MDSQSRWKTSDRVELIRRLFVIYPSGKSAEKAEAYIEETAHVPLPVLSAALQATVRTWEKTVTPPLAVILASVRQVQTGESNRVDYDQIPEGKPWSDAELEEARRHRESYASLRSKQPPPPMPPVDDPFA